jgi:hypothetical protein
MRAGQFTKIVWILFTILSILILSQTMINAQFTLYNSFYYPGSYLTPFPYPFLPVFDPFFTTYNPAPAPTFYNPAYFTPTPVFPTALTPPAISLSPVASISAATTLVPLTPVTTIAGVIIADFLINTGNPQVTAVLNLIIQDPTLLDNPFLLDALINTGNPDVASALAWLISVL